MLRPSDDVLATLEAATEEAAKEPSKEFHSFISQASTTGIRVTLPVEHNASPLNVGLYALVTNEYSGTGTKIFGYPFLKDAILMEPYRDNTITLKGFTSGCSIIYSFTGITDKTILLTETIEHSEDGIFTIKPTKTGQYTFHVEQSCDSDSTGVTKRELTQTVWVKYVRRELMSLTDEDREEFLDGFRKLWEVTTRDGMDYFGKNYKSLHYLAAVHNDAGANAVCDEFHDGTGFLNNHIYLGMYLEQSLRMINPKLSMHYIDYTKYFEAHEFENHVVSQMDGGNWTDIFSDKWFGKNDPYSGVITDSRWAYTKTPYVTTEFLNSEMIMDKATFFPQEERAWLLKTGPHINSPYGLLRAPWNYNPSAYTTRYNNVNRLSGGSVPERVMKPFLGTTCDDMKSFFAEYAVGKPLYMFLENAEENVHGYVHDTIGGMGGDQAAKIDAILKDQYQLTDTHLFYIAEATHKFVKSYLTGADLTIENPLVCTGTPWVNGRLISTAHPGDEGGPNCVCNPSYTESEERLNTLIDLYFGRYMPEDDTIFNLDFQVRKEVMELACQRMSYEGDLVGSGAPMDPLFWVIHPAMDRMFQRVMFADVLSDTLYKTSKKSVGCSGHEVTGSKRWLKGLFLEDISIELSQITNEQLAEILNPTTDMYRDLQNSVYADSEYPWCEGFNKWLGEGEVEVAAAAEKAAEKKRGAYYDTLMTSSFVGAISNAGTEVGSYISSIFMQSSRFFSSSTSASS